MEDILVGRIETLARENGRLEQLADDQAGTIAQLKHDLHNNSRRLASEYVQGLFGAVLDDPSNKIRLIKLHRAIFNSGLREAKLAIEASELFNKARAENGVIEQWAPPGL